MRCGAPVIEAIVAPPLAPLNAFFHSSAATSGETTLSSVPLRIKMGQVMEAS